MIGLIPTTTALNTLSLSLGLAGILGGETSREQPKFEDDPQNVVFADDSGR